MLIYRVRHYKIGHVVRDALECIAKSPACEGGTGPGDFIVDEQHTAVENGIRSDLGDWTNSFECAPDSR